MGKSKSHIGKILWNKFLHNSKPIKRLVSETTKYISNPKYIKNKSGRWINKYTGRYVSNSIAEFKRPVNIKIFKVRSHYEGFIDDKFVCSGDTYSECDSDLDMCLGNIIK